VTNDAEEIRVDDGISATCNSVASTANTPSATQCICNGVGLAFAF
jgi:hypothetical protein